MIVSRDARGESVNGHRSARLIPGSSRARFTFSLRFRLSRGNCLLGCLWTAESAFHCAMGDRRKNASREGHALIKLAISSSPATQHPSLVSAVQKVYLALRVAIAAVCSSVYQANGGGVFHAYAYAFRHSSHRKSKGEEYRVARGIKSV